MKHYNRWRQAAALLLTAGILSGCKAGVPIMSELKEAKGYTRAQTMIFVATERNRYEDAYTDRVWEVQLDEDTRFEEYFIRQIRDFLTKMRTMNLLAADRELTLTGAEEQKLKEASEAFYKGLSEADKEILGVSEEDVSIMYREYYIANKTVDELTKDQDLEISDDEAKVITVDQIKVSDEVTAQSIYDRVTAEGADYGAIAKETSEDSDIRIQVKKGQKDRAYETAAYGLSTDQISPVISSGGAYYILKCVNDYDEEATQEYKQELHQEKKDRIFKGIYDQFQAEHPVASDSDTWKDMAFTSENQAKTADFFQYYEEYISK